MIGGEKEVVDRLSPIFASVAPGVGDAARTPGRTGDPTRPSTGTTTAARTAPATS